MIANVLTMLYYSPTLDRECPSWVYASWSIGLFLYQTFDAIDGTQARRTHQSGPLGELFDHGVDALNTSLEVLLFAAAMQFGQGWRTVLVLFACLSSLIVMAASSLADVARPTHLLRSDLGRIPHQSKHPVYRYKPLL